jgi:hypothetical protein
VYERLRRAVEAAAVAQVAVDRHSRRPVARRVETRRRQRPQRSTLLGELLVNAEAACRVHPAVAGPVAPAGVLLVELGQ